MTAEQSWAVKIELGCKCSAGTVLAEIVCALAEQSWAVKIELGYECSAGTGRDCV